MTKVHFGCKFYSKTQLGSGGIVVHYMQQITSFVINLLPFGEEMYLTDNLSIENHAPLNSLISSMFFSSLTLQA